MIAPGPFSVGSSIHSHGNEAVLEAACLDEHSKRLPLEINFGFMAREIKLDAPKCATTANVECEWLGYCVFGQQAPKKELLHQFTVLYDLLEQILLLNDPLYSQGCCTRQWMRLENSEISSYFTSKVALPDMCVHV